MSAGRVAWIDHSKGIGIILVVMSVAALGYGAPEEGLNWMLGVTAWTKPFLVPAFFLMAGLFLHRTLFGSTPAYFDHKVLRLAYFFALWLAIETVLLNAGTLSKGLPELAGLYAHNLIAPESPLWFIQQLLLFYLVAWAIRRQKPARILAGAAVMQVLAAAGLFQSGWSVLDHFAANFVFFYAGYAGASLMFRFASGIVTRMQDLAWGLIVWAGVHTAFVAMGIADLPIVSLILGFAGSFALVGAGVILARLPAAHFIGDTGRHCFAVYLGFFIPLQVLLALVNISGIFADAGAASLAIAAAALMAALGMQRLAMETPLRALYVRPRIFRLKLSQGSGRGSLLVSPTQPDA